MGGSKSTTRVETKYVQRPLSKQEKDLIEAQRFLAEKLGKYSEVSAKRSQEQYDLWKRHYLPVEQRFVDAVFGVNKDLWKPDEAFLDRIIGGAASSVMTSTKQAQKQLQSLFAKRGLTGSGIEAKALSGLRAQALQAYNAAINDAFWKALQQSNVIRQQQLQNIGAAVNIGRSGFTGSLQYQGLAGQQAQAGIGGYASAFRSYDSTWKPYTLQTSMSRGPSPLWEVAGTALGYMALKSDARLKKNIELVGKVGHYNIYKWDWVDERYEAYPTVGVIAQEVARIKPEAVFTDSDGYLAVRYDLL